MAWAINFILLLWGAWLFVVNQVKELVQSRPSSRWRAQNLFMHTAKPTCFVAMGTGLTGLTWSPLLTGKWRCWWRVPAWNATVLAAMFPPCHNAIILGFHCGWIGLYSNQKKVRGAIRRHFHIGFSQPVLFDSKHCPVQLQWCDFFSGWIDSLDHSQYSIGILYRHAVKCIAAFAEPW